jgi:(R,R)-butanediol dehydrogenase/meso-butanediol dehydrogenase/diacetyl reductase
MKAARFYGKHDIRVETAPEPGSLKHGQVLIAPTRCGICGTDLHEFESGPIFTPKSPNAFSGAVLPQILGHEFAARVVAVGDGAAGVKPGDRVSIQPQIGPRHDYYGRRNLSFLGPLSSVVGLNWPWGGMAQQAVVMDYNCVPMPDDITDQQGALIEPAAVAVHAIDRSGVQPGGSLLITGAGPIGALTLLAAKAAGITRIIVSEPNPNRRRRIEAMGIAAAVVDPASEDLRDIVKSHTEEGVGVDAAIECAGSPRALQAALEGVRPQGTVVQVGLMGGPVEISAFHLTMRDVTLRGSLNYPLTTWPRIFEMIRGGILPVDQVVDAEIPVEDVVKGGFVPLLDKAGAKMKILVAID